MIAYGTSSWQRFFPALVVSCLSALILGLLPPSHAAAQRGPDAKAPAPPVRSRAARLGSIARNPYIGAIVVDAATGRVLFQDRPDAKGYPASVLKLMDLLIVLERIERRQLSFQDTVTVSAKAARTGGSQVWLAEKEVFTVDELLYALMVQSANDAAVALAEKVAGSTDSFVELMNQRARQLGMVNTHFHSVHGLPPGPGQQPDVTTPRDLAVLCRALLVHKDTLRYTATRERPFRPNAGKKTVIMRTHNHLMAQVQGCDGFKTGYFSKAGFSLAATAFRNGRRVIAIVLGSSDRKGRDAKAADLLAKGFLALQALPAPRPPAAQALARPRR
jgi:serine-type D-Ala-D-Ala carboxypeptidase (penicillin-binding protein 5/6)